MTDAWEYEVRCVGTTWIRRVEEERPDPTDWRDDCELRRIRPLEISEDGEFVGCFAEIYSPHYNEWKEEVYSSMITPTIDGVRNVRPLVRTGEPPFPSIPRSAPSPAYKLQLEFEEASLDEIFELEDKLREFGIVPGGTGMGTTQLAEGHDRIIRDWYIDEHSENIKVKKL